MYIFWRIVHKIKYFPKELKWFFQRGFRGWADCDWWDAYHYIGKNIVEMLREMADRGMGYPTSLEEKPFEETKFDEEMRKKWEEILRKIAYGFDEYLKWEEDDKYSDDFRNDKDGKFDTEKYQNEQKKRCDQVKESCRLMGEYFGNLWD